MYKNKKVIVVSPVGRKHSMECLFKNVLKNTDIIDEHHLWMNTNVESDIEFIKNYYNTFPNFVKLKSGCTDLDPLQMTRADNVKHFYNYCVDPDTFYFKMDDDIIYIEDNMFKEMCEFKINNPDIFLVYPTIINNPWCSYFLIKNNIIKGPLCEVFDKLWYQEFNKVKDIIKKSDKIMSDNYNEPKAKEYMSENLWLSPIYWKDPLFAENLLEYFLDIIKENKFYQLNFNNILLDYEPISINCIMWSGEHFLEFNGDIKCYADEPWLATYYPLYTNKKNVLLGNTRCVHYSFWPQKEYLDKTKILEKYSKIFE